MKFLEDYEIGERQELGSHTFTKDEIIAFATKYDPQPFHISEEAAAKSPYGRLIASGWHTSAVTMRYIVQGKKSEDEELRARGLPVANSGPSPGVREVRWVKPVHPGDTITFAAEVVDKREVKRPGWGLLTSRQTGTNQHGELVYSVTGSVFVESRPKG
jgi:acyl dehydratase